MTELNKAEWENHIKRFLHHYEVSGLKSREADYHLAQAMKISGVGRSNTEIQNI